jgi:hypothetical protein
MSNLVPRVYQEEAAREALRGNKSARTSLFLPLLSRCERADRLN